MSGAVELPREVLLVCVARIGDTLLATPLARALKARWPRARLTVVAHPKRASVLQGIACIDRVVGMTKRSAVWRKFFGGKQYDLAVVLGHDAALVGYALRTAREVVAFSQGPALDVKLAVAVPRAPPPLPAVDERLQLLRALGIEAADKRLAYSVSESERLHAQQWLAAHGVPPLARLVALQAASFPTKAYRNWPVENFQALARAMLERWDDVWLLLLGDASDAARVAQIAAGLPRVVIAAGQVSLRESAALMAVSRLYVGVDTGPTHIAGALGLPMVVMYHGLHPGRLLAPQSHPAPLAVIEHPKGPACTEADGMDAISVEQVFAHIEKVLA